MEKFKIGFNLPHGNAHIIEEEVDSVLNEISNSITVQKKDIEKTLKGGNNILNSFIPHTELNEKVWKNDGLINSKVRLKLLDIADAFIDSLEVDWVEVDDIILTGSLANYNWSKYSDFDVHILIDFSKVDDRTDLVKNYFNSKRKIWNQEHEDLKIYGFPVELYVQDSKEEHHSSGVYSLETNTWIVKPSKTNFKNVKLNKSLILKKTSDVVEKINDLCNLFNTTKDKHQLELLYKKIKNLQDKIRGARKDGLKRSGEYSPFNILYKVLRRIGYLDIIHELKTKIYDKINSIN